MTASEDRTPKSAHSAGDEDQKVVVSEGKAVETPFKSRINLMHLFGSPPPAKEGEDRPDSGVSSDKEGEPSKRVKNLFGPINMKCLLCCDSAVICPGHHGPRRDGSPSSQGALVCHLRPT